MSYIALLGEYDSTFSPHVATGIAIRHSSAVLGTAIKGEWVSTQDIDESLFSRYSGLWVAPGSPYKNLERTVWALEHARKNSVPCFGTCGGFQHMVLEYARNVLHYRDAQPLNTTHTHRHCSSRASPARWRAVRWSLGSRADR